VPILPRWTCAYKRRSIPAAAWPRLSWPDGSWCLLVVEGITEKMVAIAVAAGDVLGHGAEGGKDGAGIGEAVGKLLDVQLLSLVRTCEDGAWRWHTRIGHGRRRCDEGLRP